MTLQWFVIVNNLYVDVYQRRSVQLMNEVKILKSVQHVSIKCFYTFLCFFTFISAVLFNIQFIYAKSVYHFYAPMHKTVLLLYCSI